MPAANQGSDHEWRIDRHPPSLSLVILSPCRSLPSPRPGTFQKTIQNLLRELFDRDWESLRPMILSPTSACSPALRRNKSRQAKKSTNQDSTSRSPFRAALSHLLSTNPQ